MFNFLVKITTFLKKSDMFMKNFFFEKIEHELFLIKFILKLKNCFNTFIYLFSNKCQNKNIGFHIENNGILFWHFNMVKMSPMRYPIQTKLIPKVIFKRDTFSNSLLWRNNKHCYALTTHIVY